VSGHAWRTDEPPAGPGATQGVHAVVTGQRARLSDGRYTKIDPPDSLFTLPSGINNRGQIVGGYLDPNGVNGRGFLWDHGQYTTIVAPGDRTDSVAFDINERGDIVIPADGTVYRLPEIACGRPTVPASTAQPSLPTSDSMVALPAAAATMSP
jgi:uncharacterized membrane protein